MVDIRPNVLPAAILPLRSGDALIVDQGADGVRQTDPFSMTDSVAPVASQAEAVAGADNTKRMTSLRTKQSIASEVGVTLASNTQGAKADSAVQSVNGKTGNSVTLVKGDVGLGNVDNTSDLDKPISTATQAALNSKANSSVTISAGAGLAGGGNLTANRALALNSASIASLAKADSAVQTVNGIAPTGGDVTVSAEEKRLQDTRATAIAESFGNNVLFVETAGYSSVGDGGGALYKRVSSEPTHAGKLQSADGKWWELCTNEAIPQQFGAKGDFKQINTSNSAGSTAVTSSAGTFTPAHVGCQITIQTGAGTATRRNVVAYVSDSQVTVNTPIATAYTGASAYLGTLDTAAVNNCFAYAVAKNVPVALSKIYLIDGTITNSGSSISVYGKGPQNSGFVIDSSTGGLSLSSSGSPYSFPYSGVLLEDFSVRSGFEVNTSSGLISYSSSMTGSPQRYVMINNVNVNTLGAGFNCGVNLVDASNYSTRDLQIAGLGSILSGSVGLKVVGNSQPIDMYNTGLKVYFCDKNIEILGNAVSGSTMEAIAFIGCISIFTNYGLSCSHSTYMPYLAVMDSNINGYKRDIVALNVTQMKIDNNLFYSADRIPHEANWTGIEISYSSATALSNPSNNTITNNTFTGDNSPSVTTYGITINSTSAKNVTTQIDGNHFLGLSFAVITGSGVTGVTVADTNYYDRVGTKTSISTAVGNINAISQLGSSGGFGLNQGHIVKYGTVTANIGAGNRINVSYPTQFPSATRVVTLEIGSAGTSVAHAADGKSATGFSAYFPGATIGNSITFDYIAIGE